MKAITIAGNIGRDAETRTTQGGGNVTSWPVAVEERKGTDKRTVWFDVALWGARGDALAQYLTKGSKVAVSGELSTREHDGKTYLTVRADQVTLLGGGQTQERQAPAPHATQAARQNPARPDIDDEIPF
jgi:single-strand DNA-binding protein